MRVNRWNIARRCVQLLVVALLATPTFGWTLFEGNLASASLLGLKLSDPLAALQILLLTGGLALQVLIGTLTVLVVYWIFGGRSFCGWICPVHLLTDMLDLIPGRDHLARWKNEWKWVSLGVVVALTLLSGLPVFETVSPISITGRALNFGVGPGLIILLLIVVVELFLIRRVWCRSLCPLGAVYAGLGRISPLKVVYRNDLCTHCGRCQQVCFVPEVLEPAIERGASLVQSGECTRCAACIGDCPVNALTFGYRKP